jgi:site-specific recombinase XerD
VNELERLLAATDTLQAQNSPLHATSMRTLLLLLYGTGMRIGEALAITLHDVDLVQQILTIHNTKFFKMRLVPIGPRLTAVLADYALRRRQLPMPAGEASAFIATRTGKRWHYRNVNKYFGRVRRAAGIGRESSARYQPRIHDLRHTAAVHRVIAWYRDGANVQRLLPHLATYLQHGRPPSSSRRVFLRAKAPIRGFLSPCAVGSIVRHALLRAGIEAPTTGAHQFRHGLATEMLREGASLAQIGELLGHTSPETTKIYTKVDLDALRTLALPWPGGGR